MSEIEEEFQDAPRRRPRPRTRRPRPAQAVVTVELPTPLAEKPSQARPFDQERWLGEPPWRDDAKVQEWETAHGHDVRLKCYPEFGCAAIEHESDAREERITELEAELRRIKHGYGTEAMETEAILAEALGYAHDEEYGWIVGDHTTVTLAMEARRQLQILQRQVSEVRHAAVEACDASGLIDAGWLLGLVAASTRPPTREDIVRGQEVWQCRPRERAHCAPGCNWLETREHSAECKVGRVADEPGTGAGPTGADAAPA